MNINEPCSGPNCVAITGTATGDSTVGVLGKGDAVGVRGEGRGWHGVAGISDSTTGGFGVFGAHTARGTGVVGESTGWHAVGGFAGSESQGAGVYGEHKGGFAGVWGNNINDTNAAGTGVVGKSKAGTGVRGESDQASGVHGRGPIGGFFEGGTFAMRAVALGEANAAIIATGIGHGEDMAGIFEGNVRVNKSVTTTDVLILGADCAEDFETMPSADIEPGTVMAIGDDARLVESDRAYDKRVAGIVSGAGDYKPGIVLGKDASRKDRVPLALIGRVFCKIDATQAPIEVGDLLTTSPTQGHAMKAEDPLKAFGAVIGKALAPLREGRGLLPILVALQ
jgi:hypothetical protein